MASDTAPDAPPPRDDLPRDDPPRGGQPLDEHRPEEELFARLVAGLEGEPSPENVARLAARLPDDVSRQSFLRMVTEYEELGEGLDAPKPEPREPPPELHRGMRLEDRYRVDELLGEGGMGQVWRAQDEQLQRPVALKILTVSSAGTLDADELLRQEALLMASLRHPNIVPVFAVLKTAGITALVMELVDGQTLEHVVAEVSKRVETEGPEARTPQTLLDAIAEPLPPGRRLLLHPDDDWYRAVTRIFHDLAHTVEQAHAAGVLHRDLKAPNVLLQGDASPVVLDFGLAAARGSASDPIGEGLFGTAGYVAPEQVEAKRTGCDPRTDVYQLGLLYYELLTLQPAFTGTGIVEILGLVAAGDFTSLRERDPGIPETLAHACQRAMARDPEARFQSVAALREELERLLGMDDRSWWQRLFGS